MAEFSLIRSFGVDNGELDGRSPAECFVLGYECALFDEKLKERRPFDVTIHEDNLERLQRHAINQGFTVIRSWCPDDSSESWVYLRVAPNRESEDKP